MTFPKGPISDYKHPSRSVRDPRFLSQMSSYPSPSSVCLPWPPMEEIPRESQTKPPPQTK